MSIDKKFSKQISFLDQPKICTKLPRITDSSLLAELAARGIKLTDVGKDVPPIRILLGADVIGSILTGKIEVMKSGISAVETLFGWTVLGVGRKKEVINMVTMSLQNFEIKQMWDLETLGITDPVENKNKKLTDDETLLHFQETVRINKEQRYEVALPWLAGHPSLPNNYDEAFVRLQRVTKRLLKEDIFTAYHEIFLRWENEGIIEEVTTTEVLEPIYYLPHRPVIKLSSPTTKIRPVFDASFKVAGCASLNECLSTGPSLIQHIPSLLNRFRLGVIGVTADIKQAFLQLSVRAEDRDVLRFLWWNGPSWLKNPESTWPQTSDVCPEEALMERRKVVVGVTNLQLTEVFSTRFLYFSKYTKIVRMVAWILRFCANLRTKDKVLSKTLSSEEIRKAEVAIVKIIQSEWSEDNRKKYENSMTFYKDQEVLKVKTRLMLGPDTEDFKCPTVLPDHPIVRRLIKHTHRLLNYAGVQRTLAHLRENFWIPRGRKIIREVLSGCKPCKRHSVKAIIAETAPLPADRINRVAVFQVTGTDLAEPIVPRGGVKTWIVIFTCAIYCAVHLELISSLSTEAFLQALRRFFARRGRISTMYMYSDNGTNFIGTSRALQSLDWNAIQAETGIKKIKWIFNPPSAPWYGGWWERLSRLLKDLLKRNLGRASLNYEEMTTILCDCESTINKRPLTYLSEDPNEPTPITPAHFIHEIQSSENETIDLDIVEGSHLRKRIRYLQKLRENLRKRFKKEYLAELVKNSEKKRVESIQVGDVVLVGSDNNKRINWPLACVTELFIGKDGKKRVAKLKLANTEIIRPLQRLYPLEVRAQELHSPKDVIQGNQPLTVPEHDKENPVEALSKSVTFDNKASDVKAIDREFTRKGRKIIKPKRLDL